FVCIDHRRHGGHEKGRRYIILFQNTQDTRHTCTWTVLPLAHATDGVTAILQFESFMIGIERNGDGHLRAVLPLRRFQGTPRPHLVELPTPCFLVPCP